MVNIAFSRFESSPITFAEWDAFVKNGCVGHVFQLPHWAIYRRKTGWTPYLLSLSENNVLLATCLVLHHSVLGLPFGGILYVSRGPVLDYQHPAAPDLFSQILTYLKGVSQRRLALVQISPDIQKTANPWVMDVLKREGFTKASRSIQHETTLRLDLAAPLEQIMAQMEKRRRQEIRKYELDKNSWMIDSSNSRDSLNIFYRLYQKTMLTARQKPKCFDHLLIMYEILSEAQACSVFIANKDGCPMAGAFVIACGKRLWYLYGGSEKDASASGSGVILHWEIIKWAHDHGYQEYDLQGFPNGVERDDPLYGVYLFKRGWGGRITDLLGEYIYSPILGFERLLNWCIN